MPFTIPGHTEKFEGKDLGWLLPKRFTDSFRCRAYMRELKKWLEAGNKIHIEFTKGARKGTVARLDIKPEELDTLYKDIRTGNGDQLDMVKDTWELVFDDRPNKIKVEHWSYRAKWPGVARFDIKETVWAYEAKAKEEKPKKIVKDHFGVVIEPEMLVMFPHGRKGDIHTRFGFVHSITEAGTVKVTSIKTRESHTKETTALSPTVYASDIVVLDGDLVSKVTLAKLTNG